MILWSNRFLFEIRRSNEHVLQMSKNTNTPGKGLSMMLLKLFSEFPWPSGFFLFQFFPVPCVTPSNGQGKRKMIDGDEHSSPDSSPRKEMSKQPRHLGDCMRVCTDSHPRSEQTIRDSLGEKKRWEYTLLGRVRIDITLSSKREQRVGKFSRALTIEIRLGFTTAENDALHYAVRQQCVFKIASRSTLSCCRDLLLSYRIFSWSVSIQHAPQDNSASLPTLPC